MSDKEVEQSSENITEPIRHLSETDNIGTFTRELDDMRQDEEALPDDENEDAALVEYNEEMKLANLKRLQISTPTVNQIRSRP